MHKKTCHFALMTLVALLSGCASWTPRLSVDAAPTGKDAYLFGNFIIDSKKSWLSGIDGYSTMGFVFACQSGESVTIRFDNEFPLQLIKAPVGRCSFKETIYTNGDGQINKRNPAPKHMFQNIVLNPNTAYYLGDYSAELINRTSGSFAITEWKMKEVTDQYETTAMKMKKMYPKLESVLIENQMAKPFGGGEVPQMKRERQDEVKSRVHHPS